MTITPFARPIATIKGLPEDTFLTLSERAEPFPDDLLVLLLVSAN